ncbi:MAG: acetyl-CoA carboxylase biotin carboxyl carrier protein [Candidatus Krumholzibacteria bacterium]|jgi:acetyl-CoA carboxylase biotin carboxyl carrier protein|nr:acetyl-CoA carboxylase biotin carboxyl carrier protein [Candidatus Krumholzibacteria bacterium]
MDIALIRALVELVLETGIAELEVEQDGLAVRIGRHGATTGVAAPGIPPVGAVADAATAVPVSTPAAAAGTRPVTSPIVGTFYRAPAPGAPNFVEVGQSVVPGQTLCIVEAMKVMNEIDAEFAGVVREICVENGQAVEAESVLFRLDPV